MSNKNINTTISNPPALKPIAQDSTITDTISSLLIIRKQWELGRQKQLPIAKAAMQSYYSLKRSLLTAVIDWFKNHTPTDVHAIRTAQWLQMNLQARMIVAMHYLTKLGVSVENSCAMLGNLTHESGDALDPTIIERVAKGKTSASGFGLAQWTYFSRLLNLFMFAREMAAQSKTSTIASVLDPLVQILFVVRVEADTTKWIKLANTKTTIPAKVYSICVSFEDPANPLDSIQLRTSHAKNALNAYKQWISSDPKLSMVTKTAADNFISQHLNF